MPKTFKPSQILRPKMPPITVNPNTNNPVPSLLDRLLGYLEPDETHLAVSPSAFVAALRELDRGNLSQSQIVNALSLTAADLAGATTVYTAVWGPTPTLPEAELVDLLTLGSTRNRADPNGAPYYSKATVKTRLGF